tara:strand:+ start:117 stop:1091 length:975 start_codon:yes stop_codon:yes gene_type:complete
MNSVICTLFEGHYHHGVAALSNSLYQCGFRGTIYVGYRGALPNWVLTKGKTEVLGKWEEAISFEPIEDLKLCFLPLDTNYSLTNYKPDFMIALWQDIAKDAEALYYFDPDIIVHESWVCFEQWVNYGIALCEDINSPMSLSHPHRIGWKNFYKKYNVDLSFKNEVYVNGGFIGLTRENIHFLELWLKLQLYMGDAIGGLQNSIFSNQSYKSTIPQTSGFRIFDKSDQDALNATIGAFNGDISFIGSEAMAFKHGTKLMFHALGIPKPWKANLLSRAFKGKPPRLVDVKYWNMKPFPIMAHSKLEIVRKKISIYLAKFLGRFYRV